MYVVHEKFVSCSIDGRSTRGEARCVTMSMICNDISIDEGASVLPDHLNQLAATANNSLLLVMYGLEALQPGGEMQLPRCRSTLCMVGQKVSMGYWLD